MGTITVEWISPKIATITFANPPVNSIVPETVSELHDAVVELSDDALIQVVILSSATEGFFFNHFDLTQASNFPVLADVTPTWVDLVLRLSRTPFVSIAKIRGRTRGGGDELALACDLRYASAEFASFGQPEVGTGILPGGGAGERLPRTIGRDRSLEVILSSADYDADIAERYGWVTRTLPDTELDQFVTTLAARLAGFDRAVLAAAKAQVNRASLPPDADLFDEYAEYSESLSCRGPI